MVRINIITMFHWFATLNWFEIITIFLQDNHMDLVEQEKNVIGKLKLEREKQRLSQLELSYRSGVSQNMIAYIECRKRTPTLTTILKLCNALNINPAVLFVDEDEQKETIKSNIIELVNRL